MMVSYKYVIFLKHTHTHTHTRARARVRKIKKQVGG